MRAAITTLAGAAAAVAGIVFLLNAQAQTEIIPLELKTTARPRIMAMCNAIRSEREFAEFGMQTCLEYIIKQRVIQYEVQAARLRAQIDVRASLESLQSDYPDDWGKPRCGDGRVDNFPEFDHVEECDDGNRRGGDGCSSHCTVE